MSQEQIDEVFRFLKLEQTAPQQIDGNSRLYLAEIAWAEMREASLREEYAEEIEWAERCIRVCAEESWCEGKQLNVRAWMIEKYGHQEGHPVLDSSILTNRFCKALSWTPRQAVQAAHDGWEKKDRELLMAQRKIKEALIRLQRIRDKLPHDERLRLEEWFVVQSELK